MLALLESGPLYFVPGALPLGFLSCVQAIRALEIHFLPSQTSKHEGLDLNCFLQAFALSELPHLGAQWHCTLALTLTVLDIPGQVRSARSQEEPDCPQGVLSPMGLGCYQGQDPFGGTPS
jgi:hypothetical protein